MEEKKFFDFKSGEKFDLNGEYSNLFGEGEVSQNPNDAKLVDAENIILELGPIYVEATSFEKYDNMYSNLIEFLSRFRTDSEEVKSMTSDDRDKLFGYGRELFNAYKQQYSNLYFNFEMTLKQWNYVDNVLTKKLSYNGQELFNYWELYMKFIKPTEDTVSQLPKQIPSFVPSLSIQSLVLFSHLLMKHEEKGSTEQFHNFRVVLSELAKMTKLFNAYGVILERETNMFNNWINALNAIDGFNNDLRTDEQ